MFRHLLRSWFRRWLPPSKGKPGVATRRKRAVRPQVEPLEQRWLPTSVTFSSPTYSVSEGALAAQIMVQLDQPAPPGGVTVHYETSNGTATAGSDYYPTGGILTFPYGGPLYQLFTVSIINDTAPEPDETVTLTLSSPVGATLGSPNPATLTILDNDGGTLPSVSIQATTPSASEAGPTSGAFTVSRTGSTANGLTVTYSIGGTATNGSDYVALSGSVVIPTGSASAGITVRPIDDSSVEPSETVVLSLLSSSSYMVGSPGQDTVTIADNDTEVPGDTLATALPVSLTTGVETELSYAIGDGLYGGRDVDLIRLSLTAGQPLTADVDARYLDSGGSLSTLDAYLRVFDASGNVLAVADNSTDPDTGAASADPALLFFPPADGTYYVGVSGSPNAGYDPTQANSGVFGSTGAYHLQLLLHGPDQPPANTVPGPQAVAEDNSRTFASWLGNGISVSDPDAGWNPVQLTLSVPSGALTLSGTTGLTFQGGANGTGSMTVRGTLASLNSALNGLSFTPAPDFNGSVTLTVTTNDLGSTGSGGPLADTDTVPITVTAVNDPPVRLAPASLPNPTVLEDSGPASLGLSGLSYGPGGGSDEAGQSLSYTVTAVPAASLGQVLLADGATVVTAGTPYTLGQLQGFLFRPAPDAFGSAAFAFAVTDDGTTNGSLDPRTLTQSLTITVSPVNDPPTFTASNPPAVSEDAGPQTVTGWATFSPGPANEASQVATYTVSTVSNPALFSALPAVSASGILAYTPAANANGTATFDVRVQDSGGTANGGVDTSATQSFTITVPAVNDPPVRIAPGSLPNLTVVEDSGTTSLGLSALAYGPGGGSDEANQALTYTVTGVPSAALGQVLLADGTTTVTANTTYALSELRGLLFRTTADIFGSATFSFTVADDGTTNGGPDPQTLTQSLTITVTAVNDPPSFTASDPPAVNEDAGTQTIANWATFSPGPANESAQTATYTISNVSNPSQFAVPPAVSASGTLTYTPAADAFGTSTFQVTVRDSGGTANGGQDTSAAQTFTITVTSVNDPPSFTKGTNQVVSEDTWPQFIPQWATNISVGPANESTQTYTFLVSADLPALFSTQPSIDPDGNLSYTPAPDANGVATVTVRLRDSGGTADDGQDTSAPQTFTITISPVNDAPVLTMPMWEFTNEDTPLVFSAAGGSAVAVTDVDAGSSPVQVSLTATHGSLTLAGTAGLTFTAGDGTADATMTFTGTLAAVNAALDGLSFTPEQDYYGSAAVAITTNDLGNTGSGGPQSASDLVWVEVNPVNDPPAAATDWVSTDPDTPVGIDVLANDRDAEGDFLVITIPAGPGHGTAVVDDHGTPDDPRDDFVRYTPESGFSGIDRFVYEVSDGLGGTDYAVVVVRVRPAPGWPINTVPGPQTTPEDTPLSFAHASRNALFVVAQAGDVTAMQASLSVTPGTGTLRLGRTTGLTFSGGGDGSESMTFSGSLGDVNRALEGLTYTPSPDFSGALDLTLTSTDLDAPGGPCTATDSVPVTVTPVNDVPVAEDDWSYTAHDNKLTVDPIGVLWNDSDADSDPLTAALVGGSGPAHGTLTFNVDGSFTYEPAAGFVGSDSFRYTVSEGTAVSAAATVTIDVYNSPPTAADDAFSVLHDSELRVPANGVLVNDADEDLDDLSASVGTSALHGTLVLSGDGSFNYTPQAGYVGDDSFTYRVSDGHEQSGEATVRIKVKDANAAPQAVSDSYSIAHDEPLGVFAGAGTLSNDTDADADPLLASLVSGPAHGTLTLHTDGSFDYTPESSYVGADSFTYKAFDGTAYSGPVTVTIQMTDAAPVAVEDRYSVLAVGSTTVTAADSVLLNDSDAEHDTLTAVVMSDPEHGGVALNPDGSFTYTPDGTFAGADSFEYFVDAGLDSAPVVVFLTAAPIARDDGYNVGGCCCDDGGLEVDAEDGVLANDSGVPGDTLTATLEPGYGPTNGTVTLYADGSFAYEPSPGYTGADSFRYAVTNQAGLSAVATVTLNVMAAPAATDGPLPVNDIDKAQKISNQGVERVEGCMESAGPDVTKWFARDLIYQLKHSLDIKLEAAWTVAAFRDQARDKMSYKWLDFGSPQEGRGVNTVVLGDLVMRKQELGNIAFMVVPTVVPTPGEMTDLAKWGLEHTSDDVHKKAVLEWKDANPKDTVEQIARVGYSIEPYWPSTPFGQVPNDRVVYRADDLVAFAAGRQISLSFMESLAPGDNAKARRILEDKLYEKNNEKLNQIHRRTRQEHGASAARLLRQ